MRLNIILLSLALIFLISCAPQEESNQDLSDEELFGNSSDVNFATGGAVGGSAGKPTVQQCQNSVYEVTSCTEDAQGTIHFCVTQTRRNGRTVEKCSTRADYCYDGDSVYDYSCDLEGTRRLERCPVACGSPDDYLICSNGGCLDTTPPECVPKSCSELEAQCGPIDDGCGISLNCGICSSDFTCDANKCVSKCDNGICDDGETTSCPGDCQTQPPEGACKTTCPLNSCGFISDGCGDYLQCARCKSGYSCDNGQCVPTDQCKYDTSSCECGYKVLNCGRTQQCSPAGLGTMGKCLVEQGYPEGQVCSMDHTCVPKAECVPRTSCEPGECGQAYDGCGGYITCDSCASGYLCTTTSGVVWPDQQKVCALVGYACGDKICNGYETCQWCPQDCSPPAGLTTCPTGPFCGDLQCNGVETAKSCPSDCKATSSTTCGNSKCESSEACYSCPGDCGACKPSCGAGGNGICSYNDADQYGNYESCDICPRDCGRCMSTCGDGKCSSSESCSSCSSDCGVCPNIPSCGDKICNTITENCITCSQDCGGCTETCNTNPHPSVNEDESCYNCPQDVGPCISTCGDGKCTVGETYISCFQDCGTEPRILTCGNGKCDAGENYKNCPWECGWQDNLCNNDGTCFHPYENSKSCPNDCVAAPHPCVNGICCDKPETWPAEWSKKEQEVIDIMNQMNAEGVECYGEKYWPQPPITMDLLTQISTRCHAMDMYVNNFLGHTSSNGLSFSDRLNDVGFGWKSGALMEVAGQGYSTASGMISGWQTSPSGHCWALPNGLPPMSAGVGYVGDPWSVNSGSPTGAATGGKGGSGKSGGAGDYWTMVRVKLPYSNGACGYWTTCSNNPTGCSFSWEPNQDCRAEREYYSPDWYCFKYPTAQGCPISDIPYCEKFPTAQGCP